MHSPRASLVLSHLLFVVLLAKIRVMHASTVVFATTNLQLDNQSTATVPRSILAQGETQGHLVTSTDYAGAHQVHGRAAGPATFGDSRTVESSARESSSLLCSSQVSTMPIAAEFR